MHVVSLCPFRVASLVFRPDESTFALTVICKATYRLQPIVSSLASVQEDPNDEENHWDDDPNRSVYSPSDRVPIKHRADVMLVGHAFAPNREPVRSLLTRLVVGDGVDKLLEVFGDASVGVDGALHNGPPFLKMPLFYERAAGGPETDNPVGIPLPTSPNARGVLHLPNLRPPGIVVDRPDMVIPPIGFGPIAKHWPERRRRLGGGIAAWNAEDRCPTPLADDFDVEFFNAAPNDQRLDEIRPDEPIALDHLNAMYPHLVTRLPGVRPRAFVDRGGPTLEEIALRGDTLWIETDGAVATVTFRGQVPLQCADEGGRVLILAEEADHPLSPSEIAHAIDGTAAPVFVDFSRPTEIVTFADRALADTNAGVSALPFVPPAAQGAPATPPTRVQPDHGPSIGNEPTHTTVGLPMVGIADRIPGPAWLSRGPQASPLPIEPKPPPPLTHTFTPIPPSSGVLAASNAARVADLPWSDPPQDDVEPASRTSRSAPLRRSTPSEIVELLWFDSAALERVREHPAWRDPIASLQPERPDLAFDDEEILPEEPQEVKDRRDLLGVLTDVEPTPLAALSEVLEEAVTEKGAFTPPLALVTGELQFPFDPIATLKATVTAASPIAAGNKKLKDLIDQVSTLSQMQWLEHPGAIAESLTARVREAFAEGNRLLPPDYLDAYTERMLLEGRHYQRRTMFGKTWLRAVFAGGNVAPVPTYLPESLASELPLFQKLRVKLVVEVHLSQDQYEAHAHAFRAIALGRVSSAPSRVSR